MDKTTNLHQYHSRISTQKLETASQITREAVTTHLKTASKDLKVTFSIFRNTIELPVGKNVVPLRFDTIRVKNGFILLTFVRGSNTTSSKFPKTSGPHVDSLDLDGENRERTRLHLFQFSLRDQASNWLKRLPAGSITTWEDLTTRFLAQFFPPGRTAKLRNDILMFQQHHGESLSEAWTRFKDLLQKVPHHGIDLWLQVQIFYDHVNPVTRRTIDQSAGGKLCDLNAEESWALLEDLALYDNESWNDPRDFAMPVKAISLPQDVPSTSNRRLIELENQVQRLMEAHLAPTQPTQVNKITISCEICSGPHGTQYCMEDPEQAFVEYASSHTDEAGDKWYTFKPEQNNLGDTYNPSWRSHPNLSLEGLVSNFMASQDARLSKFEADFKRQQDKNPKLGTHPVSSARSYPTIDPQRSNHVHGSINAITIHPKQPEGSYVNRPDEGQEEEGNLGNTNSNPQLDPLASIATEHIIRDDDEPQNEGLNEGEGATTEGPAVEYFDTFPTRDELTYHKYLMCGPIPSIFLKNPIITEGYPSNLKIPCNIGNVHVEKAYINLNSSLNIMTRMMYNWIMRRKLNPREDANRGVSNFTRRIKGMHVFVGNFTYIMNFMIIEDISSIIDPRLSQVVLGKSFVEISNMTHDPQEDVVRFTNRNDEVAYKMPHKIEQYNSLSNLEKEHTKSVYLRNEEDKRRGVEYVMSKILGFYKECLELGPKYLTGMDDEGEVTLYLMRRSLEVLRKFHWTILG
ncbi:MAK10-like protein [Tanacetum coccineum]